MEKQANLFQSIFDHLSEAIIAVDEKGHCLFFNSAAKRLLGMDTLNVRPDTWAESCGLYLPDGVTLYSAEDSPWDRAMRGETVDALAVFVRNASTPCGLWMHVNVRPLSQEEGTQRGGVIVFHDIRWQKLIEAEQQQRIREQTARTLTAERRSAFLAEASTLLAASIDYATTVESVTRLTIPQLADWCIIDLLNADQSITRAAVAHVDPGKEAWAQKLKNSPLHEPRGPHAASKVLRSGRSELVPEISDPQEVAGTNDADHIKIWHELGLKSYLCVPLRTRRQTLGVITLIMSDSGRHYETTDLPLAEEFAYRAALAIDNARFYQEAQEANRMKDEFLGAVSHELRAPLTSILGWAKLLRASEYDPDALAQGLETIERNAKAQAQILNDLLDLSQIITGNLPLEIHTIELVPVIEAAVLAVRPAAEAKDIRLRMVFDPEAGSVRGDASRLQQVVWNLLSNAIKFTPEGGRIQVRLERVQDHVEISVSDTGAGLHAECIPYLFDRFHHAYRASLSVPVGLGLGLAIVRHLVEWHDGSVHVESRGKGQGATFTVKLPLYEPKDSSIEDRSTHFLATHGPGLDGLRVLVVDDEPDTCRIVTEVLVRRGAEVKACDTAAKALQVLEQWQPNILVSDIGMPGEDGYALIRKVRALAPECGGQIPALALTAFVQSKDQRRVLSAGYQKHMAKPVEPAELVTVVASLVGPRENAVSPRRDPSAFLARSQGDTSVS